MRTFSDKAEELLEMNRTVSPDGSSTRRTVGGEMQRWRSRRALVTDPLLILGRLSQRAILIPKLEPTVSNIWLSLPKHATKRHDGDSRPPSSDVWQSLDHMRDGLIEKDSKILLWLNLIHP